MKISKTHHKTKKGQVKRNPVKREYVVFNYTDGILASPSTFSSIKAAKEFIKQFRARFKQQGYYKDKYWNKIPPEYIDLEIIPYDELNDGVKIFVRK